VNCLLEDRRCDGRLQTHHLIPQREIKRKYRELVRYPNHFDGPALALLLADDRNTVQLCVAHHHKVEMRRLYIRRDMLPDGVEEFAGMLGLGWYLDRFFPGRQP
jgi:hypothetical protein